jgi:catechol 2,3-dioxygenase-like lactoylglutathione lyase family enzyme
VAIQEIRVASVPVSDQERAKEFYVDKLGFELVRDDDSVPGSAGCRSLQGAVGRR